MTVKMNRKKEVLCAPVWKRLPADINGRNHLAAGKNDERRAGRWREEQKNDISTP